MIPGVMSKLGIVRSMAEKVVTGNADALIRMSQEMGRDAVISLVGGPGSPLGIAFNAFYRYASMVDRQYQREQARIEREENRPLTAKEKRKYAAMHRQWLQDNQWRFNWQSQPRRPAGTEAGGEWMEGRLDYMAEPKLVPSRTQRRRAAASIRAYKLRQRALGNNHTRRIRTSWGEEF